MPGPEHQTHNSITNGLKTVSYQVRGDGQCQPVAGPGWQPVNVVNAQAWQEIEKKIDRSRNKILRGQASCLHYYMTANQMDISLLARYTGQPRWLVRLHMIPFIFNMLSKSTLKRYADLFQVSEKDLAHGRLLAPVYARH